MKIKDWINEEGITELERALRVFSIVAYTTCLFYPPINREKK